MPSLHQIIAIDKGVKNEANLAITAAYHEIQKSTLFTGISRVYSPIDEEGEHLPSETQRVQKRGTDLIELTAKAMTRYWDVTLTKDTANMQATANVMVDGHLLLDNAPVTFLLFFEKQLGDLETMIKKIPVLDPAETWTYDETQDCYVTAATKTTRSKKVPKALIGAPASKEHPAQVQYFTEDVLAGYWNTIKFSGALPQKRVTELLEKIGKVRAAVKFAREEANTIPVTNRRVGDVVFDFILR